MLPIALCVLLAAPDYDAFLESSRNVALGEALTARGQALLATSHVTAVEQRLGVPTVLWAAQPPPGARTPRDMGLTATEAARRYLLQFAPVYRFDPAQLAELPVSEVHDAGGAVVVGFSRVVNGLPVFREELDVVMDQNFVLVALTGALAPFKPGQTEFALTAQTALAVAAQDLTGKFPRAESLKRVALGTSGWEYFASGDGVFREAPRARRGFFDDGERLVPAWQLELAVPLGELAYVVSAIDGRLLLRANLTAFAGYRVWAQQTAPFTPLDGPAGDSVSPHPDTSPTTFDPALVAPVLVTLDHAGISTSDPWLPAGAAELSGNNARAYADLFDPDGFNGPDAGQADFRVAPSSPGTFDFTYDFAQQPDAVTSQRAASATQAFFVVNWLHDYFYDLGFDEAARNGQADNLGRGGVGGDPMLVEVHDSSGLNGANMTARADGRSPRLQLFTWSARRPSQLVFSDGGITGGPPAADQRASWDVNGDIAAVIDSSDGGAEGCADWANRAELAGKLALVDSAAPCPFSARLTHAADAGAAGVLFSGQFFVSIPGSTLPATTIDPAVAAAVRASLDAGVAVNARLVHPPAPDRDGALDTSVVAHEWAHFLTNRLVGDSLGLINNQGRGLGEGWSDFVALLLSLRASDAAVPSNASWNGAWASSPFVTGGRDFDGRAISAAWFGIRRFPYSADVAKNPLTFRHSGQNVPLPTSAPVNPDGGGGPNNAEIHNTGEVWASMLWEAQVRLLRSPRYTVDQARKKMSEYLVASLKATPALPTFTEARDALLAVVRAASPADDFPLFVAAFAARGLGLQAQAADRRSLTNTPLAEDFTGAGGAYKLVSFAIDDAPDGCDDDGILDNDESGTVTLTLMNVGTVRLTQSVLSLSTPASVLTLPSVTILVPASDPFSVVSVSAPVSLRNVLAMTQTGVDITARVVDPQLLGSNRTFQITQSFRVNADIVDSATEGFEAGAAGWSTGGEGDRLAWEQQWQPRRTSATSNQFRGRDPDVEAMTWFTTPPLSVGAGAFSFSFMHTYVFDADLAGQRYFDGGLLEISTDGVSFTQIPGAAISPTYDGPLISTGLNPLWGKSAFRGTRATPTPVTVNLGTQYANRTVWVRWVVGSDEAVGREGWTIDDVSFTGLTNTPFRHAVGHRGKCANKPPVISNTPNQIVDERSHVTLLPGTVTDSNNDPLTFTWEQTLGAPVALTGAEFDAPEVRTTTTFGFRVTVSDGQGGTATGDMTVTVRNVNRRPVANAGTAQDAVAGATVTLDGSASSDPDGDSLRFRWAQVDGPAVTLENAETAAPTFIAPTVEAFTNLTFSLEVLDADVASEKATVVVTVAPAQKGCGCSSSPPLGLLAVFLLFARRRRLALTRPWPPSPHGEREFKVGGCAGCR